MRIHGEGRSRPGLRVLRGTAFKKVKVKVEVDTPVHRSVALQASTNHPPASLPSCSSSRPSASRHLSYPPRSS
eukprot:5018942-Prymnesium_polylepis.1